LGILKTFTKYLEGISFSGHFQSCFNLEGLKVTGSSGKGTEQMEALFQEAINQRKQVEENNEEPQWKVGHLSQRLLKIRLELSQIFRQTLWGPVKISREALLTKQFLTMQRESLKQQRK